MAVVTFLLLAASTLPASGQPAVAPDAVVDDRLVVVFEPGASSGVREAVVAAAAGTASLSGASTAPAGTALPEVGAGSPRIMAVTVEEGQADRVARELAAHPTVASVEPDVLVEAHQVTPEDPEWDDQWGVQKIRAPEMWSYTTGSEEVVVAVVDTGVDDSQPDLEGRVTAGYDFLNEDSDPADDNGHGTAVASLIAAAGDDTGIAGMCWACHVMPLKALDEDGIGHVSDAAEAIVYAVDHGADIINLSLGAWFSSAALSAAVSHANDNGVLVVASSGNFGTTEPTYPAAEPGVLAVAATTASDELESFSTYGSWVELAAPGCNVAAVATGTGEGATMEFCGTSFAAPLVAGAAALMRSAPAQPDADEIAAALTATAVDIGSGVEFGRIDGFAAFRELGLDVPDTTPPTVEVTAPVSGVSVSGTIVVFADAADASGIAQVAFAIDGETEKVDTSPPYTLTWDTTSVEEGPHVLSAEATDRQGLTSSDAVSVEVVRTDTEEAFGDVRGHAHEEAIYTIAAAGITKGCATGRFCPGAGVTRGQMATFLTRALRLPAATSLDFTDVASGNPHAPGIAALARAGITAGCDGVRFCPGDVVTRAQMATFLTRALSLPPGGSTFADVPASHPHAEGVSALDRAGITTGCRTGSFCPGTPVTRGQMATFLVRALDL